MFTFRLVATWLREANSKCQKVINFWMICFLCLKVHHGPGLILSWAASTEEYGFFPRTFHSGRTGTRCPYVGGCGRLAHGQQLSWGLNFVPPAPVLLTLRVLKWWEEIPKKDFLEQEWEARHTLQFWLAWLANLYWHFTWGVSYFNINTFTKTLTGFPITDSQGAFLNMETGFNQITPLSCLHQF